MSKQREFMPLLNPVYPPGYEEIYMDIKLRIQKGEYTKQTNELIEKVIPFNPSNYTVWVAKKRIYQAGQTTIEHEDQYSIQVLRDNVKNFQLWDFRNFIVSITKDYEKQYALIDQILEDSHKNYHCWSNRITLVNMAKNFNEEMERTKKYIVRDPYNNSIWAYRFYCFNQTQDKNIKEEFEFVFAEIKKNIDNEASWNYLRGFLPAYKLNNIENVTHKQSITNFNDQPEVKQLCQQIIQNKQISEKKKIQALITISISNSQQEQTVKYAKETCAYLAQLEPLRQNYYKWLKDN